MKDSTNKQPGLLEGYKNERLFQAFFENSQSLLMYARFDWEVYNRK